jgi:hypothetical protein
MDGVVREIEAIGFPRKEVRTLTEPAAFEVTGVTSFPRLDFEVNLSRELPGSKSCEGLDKGLSTPLAFSLHQPRRNEQ